ncbi:MAG: aldolase [Sphingobium sp. 66-54]|nr:MAG: aldolase [Sphingobium sp. 66-54]
MTIQLGTFVKTCSPQIIEVLGTSGLDFAVVDAEHAPFGRGEIDVMVMAGRAAGLPVLVRIPDHRASTILNALDVGAAGLVVPHVDTLEEARAIVDAARFGVGNRGYSSSPRFASYGSIGRAAALAKGDEALLLCQIESGEGVENAGAIAALEGVDGLFIGRADLSLSLGETDIVAPRVVAATHRIIEAGLAARKRVGMFVGSAEEAGQFAREGVDWFVVGSDQSMLRQGARAVADNAARVASAERQVQ